MDALPFSRIEKTVPKPIGKGYTENPQTIGNHIRNKRLLLKLEQKDVAAQIGVIEQVICNWETGAAEPNSGTLPKIVHFLGYIPWPTNTETFGGRLESERLFAGYSRKDLAELLGINPMTVIRWEINVYTPKPDVLEKLKKLLPKLK